MLYDNKNPQNSRHYKVVRLILIFLCLSAFGPYVLPNFGLRVEHFLIYGFLPVYILTRLGVSPNLTIPGASRILIFLFLAETIWITIVSFLSEGKGQFLQIFAACDNVFQPVILLLAGSCLVCNLASPEKKQILTTFLSTIIALLSANAILSLASVYFELFPLLKYFYGQGALHSQAVAVRASQMGRYTGIFNQPLEAGLAYSVGLLAWVYLACIAPRIKISGWIGLLLLFIGGTLSVSKVFVVGGVPLAAVLWMWLFVSAFRIRPSTVIGLLLTAAFTAFGLFLLSKHWFGFRYWARLFDLEHMSNAGIIETYTAGRFGAENTFLKSLFYEVWKNSPVWGFGAPINSAVDNAYIEFFYYGGSVGLGIYLGALVIIGVASLHGIKHNSSLGKYLFGMWVLIVLGGLGTPTLTLNRASILIWGVFIIGFSILTESKRSTLQTVAKP